MDQFNDMLNRAISILPYTGERGAARRLIGDGVEPSLAYLVVRAARLYERLKHEG